MNRASPLEQNALGVGVPDVIPAGWSPFSWSYRDLIGQRKEHSPRSKIRSVAASANVNPLDQIVLVTATATLTLESAVAADNRWHLLINDIASGTMTVAGTPTINGAASIATSTRYACVLAWSDGTEWKAQQTDLATALGTLAIANGGTGGTTAAAARTNLGLDNLLTLMSYGGLNFNGTTTYLDGNALTGIADGKKGTIVFIVRFANAASTLERLMHSTNGRLQVNRTATGNINVTADNAAGTTILNITTSGTPASAAGTYVIMASWDLATAGSGRLYVNDVSNYTETTYTNDSIDYTVTEYSLGASTTGAAFFAGDMYLVWFDPTDNLSFGSAAPRRRFLNGNGETPVYVGANGELGMSDAVTPPMLFLAYDDSNSWSRNRGSNTDSFVENGAIANATTTLKGQYAPLEDYSIPITVTADYTVGRTDLTIRNNRASTNTLTLPSAANNKGRRLRIATVQAQLVNSNASNVVPITGGAAGTAILAAVDGAWADLESNGTNWATTAG